MQKKWRSAVYTVIAVVFAFGCLAMPSTLIADVNDGLAASPWAVFSHDVQHTGRTPYSGPESPTLVWRYGTGDEIYSSPAIGADGTVYIGSLSNYFYAVNPDGSLKWQYKTTGDVYSSPAIAEDGTIYFGSFDQWVYALNPDKTLKWKFPTGSRVRSSPVIGPEGIVYIGSHDDFLYALYPNGTLKWSYELDNNIVSSPAIAPDGTIYVGCSGQYLYAFNPSGTVKWKYKTVQGTNSSPAVGSDGTIYFGTDYGNVHAVRPNGTQKWEYMAKGTVYSSPAIGVDGTIYFGSTDKHIYALNSDGSFKWKYKTADQIHSSPVLGADGTIHIGSTDGYLYAFNPDGSIKWRYLAGGAVYSSPIIGENRVMYFGSYDNHLYAIGEGYEPEGPVASFTVSPDDLRTGIEVTFDASSSSDSDGDIVKYEWNFGDLSSLYGELGLGMIVTHTFEKAGGYNVVLTATDDDGYSKTQSMAITVNLASTPIADFEYWPENPIPGDKVAFDASPSSDPDGSIVEYEWSFGDGDVSSEELLSHIYDSAGSYNVMLTVTDNDGLSHSKVVALIVNSTVAPVVSFEVWPENPEPGDRVAFDAAASQDPDGTIVSYEWDLGDGTVSTESLLTHVYASAGTYEVTLTLTDDTGNVTTENSIVQVGVPAATEAVEPPASTEDAVDDEDDSEIPAWLWMVIGGGIVLVVLLFVTLKRVISSLMTEEKAPTRAIEDKVKAKKVEKKRTKVEEKPVETEMPEPEEEEVPVAEEEPESEVEEVDSTEEDA